jgi:hypothetical protein
LPCCHRRCTRLSERRPHHRHVCTNPRTVLQSSTSGRADVHAGVEPQLPASICQDGARARRVTARPSSDAYGSNTSLYSSDSRSWADAAATHHVMVRASSLVPRSGERVTRPPGLPPNRRYLRPLRMRAAGSTRTIEPHTKPFVVIPQIWVVLRRTFPCASHARLTYGTGRLPRYLPEHSESGVGRYNARGHRSVTQVTGVMKPSVRFDSLTPYWNES